MAQAPSLTARQVATLVGGELLGNGNATIAGIAPLDRATPGDLSFAVSRAHRNALANSNAGVVLIPGTLRDHPTRVGARIVVSDPMRALIAATGGLYPQPEPTWGIHPSAQLGRHVRWNERISIGPRVTIGDGVVFGGDCIVESNVHIGQSVRMGERCRIGSDVVIGAGSALGDRVKIKPGAIIGTEGFSYHAADAQYVGVPHIGPCRIGDDVEIGANSTIDRGSLGETVVAEGTKIDNLVHVAHNVRIGKRCLIMAQVGIAGSAVVEDEVVLAGQAGLADHVHVERGARVAAQSGVIGRIGAGTTVSGYPARDHRQVLRQSAALERVAPLITDLERLTNRG